MSDRLLIYDASEKSFLGLLWKIGAALAWFYFDKILPVKNWQDFQNKVEELGNKYDEVQFWGHGSPGYIYINNYSNKNTAWEILSRVLNKGAVVWLRVCSFASQEMGKAAMERVSSTLGARLIANTHSIGQWGCQSGVRSVAPGEGAKWPTFEGVDPSGDYAMSAPWKPNTVTALRLSPPRWAKSTD